MKYFNTDDAHHLITSIQKYYQCHIDWSGQHYIGFTIDWNYTKGFVDISLSNYIKHLLKRFGYMSSNKPQYSPHSHYNYHPVKKGHQQLATEPDTSAPLNKKETKRIQSIIGSLLYYARAIDSTILPALNDIAMYQSAPTEHIKSKCKQLLDYAATCPDVALRFCASNMQLHVDSDAAYLIAPKARSRIAGYYYFKKDKNNNDFTLPNHPILIECKCLTHVVSSAAEEETGGLFLNAQNIIVIRRILKALGHTQAPVPLKTDNKTAYGFVTDNIHQRRSKTWDMRWHWLRDKELANKIKNFWKKGTDEDDPNYADYPTKHHPISHHRGVRSYYVKDQLCNIIINYNYISSVVRGCVISPRTQD